MAQSCSDHACLCFSHHKVGRVAIFLQLISMIGGLFNPVCVTFRVIQNIF